MKNQKGISLIVIVIIIAIVIVGIIIISNSGKYELNNNESIAYSTLRREYYKSLQYTVENNTFGSITRNDLNTLGKVAKHKNGKWFNDVKQTITVKIADKSDKEQIVMISHGGYVATFTVDNYTMHCYLLDYSFEQKKLDGGVIVTITD